MKKVQSITRSKFQSGATMAEFVLAFPLIMLTIVFLIDTGIILFRYTLLTDATAALTRAATTKMGQSQATGAHPCSSMVSMATQSKEQMVAATPNLFQDMTFKMTISNTAGVPYQLISMHGDFPLNCLLCQFFPTTLHLEHKSVLAIERELPCTGAPMTDQAM